MIQIKRFKNIKDKKKCSYLLKYGHPSNQYLVEYIDTTNCRLTDGNHIVVYKRDYRFKDIINKGRVYWVSEIEDLYYNRGEVVAWFELYKLNKTELNKLKLVNKLNK